MRRLNLLRQLLFGDTIGSLDEWSASTRHIFAVLNMINSRRGWQDVLVISNRDLLSAAGYKQSRYSNGLIKRFQTEATASGVIDLDVSSGVCTYFIKALSTADVAMAKDRRAPKTAANIPPKLAARLAEERDRARTDGAGGTGNIGNGRKNGNVGRRAESVSGATDGTPGTADTDDLLQELSNLGL